MRSKLIPFCIIFVSLLSTRAFGQPPLQGDGMALRYLVQQPAKLTKTSPVIILLHGVGSNEADLFGLAPQLPKDALIISARAPITLSENSFAWYHIDFKTGAPSINNGEEEKSRQLILTFIYQVVKKYNVDPAKVFLVGFSQGAIMSYSVGLTNPQKVKGIAILSGRLLDEVKPNVAPRPQLKKLSMFIAHGTIDKVLPIAYAHSAHDYINKLKLSCSYHEYKMAHEICPQELADLRQWFSSQMH